MHRLLDICETYVAASRRGKVLKFRAKIAFTELLYVGSIVDSKTIDSTWVNTYTYDLCVTTLHCFIFLPLRPYHQFLLLITCKTSCVDLSAPPFYSFICASHILHFYVPFNSQTVQNLQICKSRTRKCFGDLQKCDAFALYVGASTL